MPFLFSCKCNTQLMHDFWLVSENVILYLCMRNTSISICVSFSKTKWRRIKRTHTLARTHAHRKQRRNVLALLLAINRSSAEYFTCVSVPCFVSIFLVLVVLSLANKEEKKSFSFDQYCTKEVSQSTNKLSR